MKKIIFDEYGIEVQELSKIGEYQSFRQNQSHYLIVPILHLEEEELLEIYQLTQYMLERSDSSIATIVLTKTNHLFIKGENQSRYILVKYQPHSDIRYNQIGKELAKFHQKGRLYPYPVTKIQRIGQWKFLWERRLDQLESFWRGRIGSQPLTTFEKMFAESFPYYLGLAENAIQYLVDTELDEDPKPIDSGTICHHRFNSNTWPQNQYIKLPTEWVFDHCSRDIAEYVRHLFLENEYELQLKSVRFIEEYERTTPLSIFSYRLLYSRLLFPIHYFECVENYYLSDAETKSFFENKLVEILNRSSEYEAFLRNCSNLFRIKAKRSNIPVVDWLA